MASSWRPDWRRADAYPEKRTERQWRWEFLRRCEDYQADFQQRHGAFFEQRMAAFGDQPLPPGLNSWESHYGGLAEMPGCREKYGVTILVNPAEDEPRCGMFAAEYGCPYQVHKASAEALRSMAEDHVALFAFDLKQPLKPQIEQAHKHLAILQTEEVGKPAGQRNHRAKWTRYLRVLDAKAAGARSVDVAQVLNLKPSAQADGFDPERLVSETLQQAKGVQLRFKEFS